MDDAWGTIEEIVRWLDNSSTQAPETEKLLRIMKLTPDARETFKGHLARVAGRSLSTPRVPATTS
jgi:hypothetical protein